LAAVGEQDVAGFHVAVDDEVVVEEGERLQGLADDVLDLGLGEALVKVEHQVVNGAA